MSEIKNFSPPEASYPKDIEVLEPIRIRDFAEAYPGLRVGKEIGSGGANTVYELVSDSTVKGEEKDCEHPKDLVLRLFTNPDLSSERFVKDISIHARLTDPMHGVSRIVPIFDYVLYRDPQTGEERMGAVLKHMKGGDLGDVVEEIKDESERLNFVSSSMIDVCEGLQSMHDAGVIHGDVKPDNILFNERKSAVFLSDFDISYIMREFELSLARELESKKEQFFDSWPDMLLPEHGKESKKIIKERIASLRESFYCVNVGAPRKDGGTSHYLPPECLRKGATFEYGVAVDMYSVGAILYQMRTEGLTPYQADFHLATDQDGSFLEEDPLTIKQCYERNMALYKAHYLDKIAEALVSHDPASRLSVDLDMGEGGSPQTFPLVTPMDIANAIRVASKNAGVSLDEEKIKFLRKSNELRGVPKHED